MIRQHPSTTLFPYTTLFRSEKSMVRLPCLRGARGVPSRQPNKIRGIASLSRETTTQILNLAIRLLKLLFTVSPLEFRASPNGHAGRRLPERCGAYPRSVARDAPPRDSRTRRGP